MVKEKEIDIDELREVLKQIIVELMQLSRTVSYEHIEIPDEFIEALWKVLTINEPIYIEDSLNILAEYIELIKKLASSTEFFKDVVKCIEKFQNKIDFGESGLMGYLENKQAKKEPVNAIGLQDARLLIEQQIVRLKAELAELQNKEEELDENGSGLPAAQLNESLFEGLPDTYRNILADLEKRGFNIITKIEDGSEVIVWQSDDCEFEVVYNSWKKELKFYINFLDETKGKLIIEEHFITKKTKFGYFWSEGSDGTAIWNDRLAIRNVLYEPMEKKLTFILKDGSSANLGQIGFGSKKGELKAGHKYEFVDESETKELKEQEKSNLETERKIREIKNKLEKLTAGLFALTQSKEVTIEPAVPGRLESLQQEELLIGQAI